MHTSIIRLYTVKVSVILGNLYSLISDLINRLSKLNSTYQKNLLVDDPNLFGWCQNSFIRKEKPRSPKTASLCYIVLIRKY